MERKEALVLIESKTNKKNLIKHMLAVEICMKALAKYFSEDEELWAQAGILHDLDYEDTIDNFSQHGLVAGNLLREKGVNEVVIYAIESHPGHKERVSKIDKSLYAVDPLTGLIVSATLMHPDKKLASVDTQFILNRFKEKRFAAGANREQIKSCEELGLSLQEFIAICLNAMKEISEDLGL